MRHCAVLLGAMLVAFLANAPSASAQEEDYFAQPMRAPSQALELKVGTGYTQGFGMIAPGRSLPNVGGAGLAVDANVGYRLDPAWSLGVQAEYDELTSELNSGARGMAGNVGATYHVAPSLAGDPWVRLGTGYRLLWEMDPNGATGTQVMRHGFELASLRIGYDARITEDIAVAPLIGADVNLFLWQNEGGTNTALSSAQAGTFIYAGLSGRFDLGGHEPTQVAAATVPPPQPMPPARLVAPHPQVGVTNAQPAAPIVPNSSTATNVSISPEVLRACDIPDADAYFGFDSAQLTAFDHAPLDALATCFTEGRMAGQKLDLVGHSDSRGSSDHNMALGQSRAEAVSEYLISRGVKQSQVTATSRGAMDATGQDATGWAHDRRVDVLLSK